MSEPPRYRPKDRDQITWERDRTRLQTEARLFMAEVLNGALAELAYERRKHTTPSDTDCQFLVIKHVIGQVCAPERRELANDAAVAVSSETETSAIGAALAKATEIEQGAGDDAPES